MSGLRRALGAVTGWLGGCALMFAVSAQDLPMANTFPAGGGQPSTPGAETSRAPLPLTPPSAGAEGVAPMTVPAGGRPMSDREIDQAVEALFGTAGKIQYFQSELRTDTYETDTPDSQPKDVKTSYGFLRLSTPNLMFLQDYGEDDKGRPRTRAPRNAVESSYMIIDGRTFFDIQASTGRGRNPKGRRDALPDYIAGGKAGNIAAMLGILLGLNREVSSASEMRADFVLQGATEPAAGGGGAVHHVRLHPRGANMGNYQIDLWHVPGTALPSRVKMVEKRSVYVPGQGTRDNFVYSHTERTLTGTRSNLDGLAPLGRASFEVPRMRVDWEDDQAGERR